MTARRPKHETAELGEAIYQRDIRSLVEAEHHGDYVAIDVSSGCWSVADSLLDAPSRLREEHPDVVDVWTVRVGHQAIHRIGSRQL